MSDLQIKRCKSFHDKLDLHNFSNGDGFPALEAQIIQSSMNKKNGLVFSVTRRYRVGPWEKVSQNIDPFKNNFFVNNYQHWTGTSASQPFLTPPYPWGGLGGPGGGLGGSADPKIAIFVRRPISALECNVLG